MNKNNHNIISIIPARMGSSRFPNKPMALIQNTPMIGYVYNSVKKNKLLKKVVVATCDQIIKDYIVSIGGESVMTSNTHERASDRCAEAIQTIESNEKFNYEIVVMIQGDEPLINSEMITQSLMPMINDKSINVTNLMGKIITKQELNDPNCIKVVCDQSNNALLFSREPIPYSKIYEGPFYKQICVIPFRKKFLLDYTKMNPTRLEKIESIDMLRILENGYNVYMSYTDYQNQSVDTPEDLIKVNKIISSKQ